MAAAMTKTACGGRMGLRAVRPTVVVRRTAPCRVAQSEAPATTATTAKPVSLVAGKVAQWDAPQFDELMSAAGSRLVVVDIYTAWCGPCKMIAPELENIAAEHGDKMVMSKMDCTSNPDNKKWAMAQNVKALPTFILFKNGVRVSDMSGAKPANLRKLIDAHM